MSGVWAGPFALTIIHSDVEVTLATPLLYARLGAGGRAVHEPSCCPYGLFPPGETQNQTPILLLLGRLGMESMGALRAWVALRSVISHCPGSLAPHPTGVP